MSGDGEGPADGEPLESTHDSLCSAIRELFPAPAYVYLPGVPDGTGARQWRIADAAVMGVWPSRGLELVGFEVKASRSDWLRELKDPSKAERIARFCDKWYLVAASHDVVAFGELPSGWGLIIPHRGTLKIMKEAPPLKPEPITREFLAALLRRVTETWGPKRDAREEYQKGVADGKAEAATEAKWLKESHERLERQVAEFEKASGVKVENAWNHGEVGEAVKLVLEAKLGKAVGRVESLVRQHEELGRIAAEGLATLRRIQGGDKNG